MLAIDPLDLARPRIRDRSKDARYKWQEILQRTTGCYENDDAKRGPDQILLELKILVARQEDFEPRFLGTSQ